jgi:hypothetical protein
MISFTILIAICFIIATIRIKLNSKRENIDFSPFEATSFDYIIFSFGGAYLFSIIMVLFFKFLP